jgi:hypothetical protein
MSTGMSTLTQKRLLELLRYDQETGVFFWRESRGSIKCGAVAASTNSLGYVQIQIDSKNYLGHRLAWLYVYGSWPQHTLDHINGHRSDNRICNLRDVSHQLNLQNVRAPKNSKTGLIGVSRSGNRWRAYIFVDGKQRHLGCKATAVEARGPRSRV